MIYHIFISKLTTGFQKCANPMSAVSLYVQRNIGHFTLFLEKYIVWNWTVNTSYIVMCWQKYCTCSRNFKHNQKKYDNWDIICTFLLAVVLRIEDWIVRMRHIKHRYSTLDGVWYIVMHGVGAKRLQVHQQNVRLGQSTTYITLVSL